MTQLTIITAAATLVGCSTSAGMTGTPSPVVPAVTQAESAPLTAKDDSNVDDSNTTRADAAESTQAPSTCAGGKFLLL